MNNTKASIQTTGEHQARFIASTEKSDSHGDTIQADGWQLDSFKSNPVLLFGHDQRALPVGVVTNVFIKNNELIADVDFTEAAKIDDFAAKVAAFVKAGILKAVSVGFQALEYEPRYENNEFMGFNFTKQVLKEISIVPVPANDEALLLAKSLHLGESDRARLLFKTEQNKPAPDNNANKIKLIKIRARIK